MGMKNFIAIVLTAAAILAGCSRTNDVKLNTPTPMPTVAANSNNALPDPPTDTTPRGVVLDSAGGAKIIGTFYPSPKANSPAILMLHQWMKDRTTFDDLAKRMQAKGIGVLTIDGRGFGESVKTADGATIAPEKTNEAVEGMKADVKAAFEYLAKQDNVDRNQMGIIGASYGSSLGIMFAADEPKVKAIALLSPGLNYFGNLPTDPAVRKYGNRPMLLVAAEDDKESAGAVTKLKEAGNSSAHEIKVYKQGGHGTDIFAAKVGLEDMLIEFFTRHLLAVTV